MSPTRNKIFSKNGGLKGGGKKVLCDICKTDVEPDQVIHITGTYYPNKKYKCRDKTRCEQNKREAAEKKKPTASTSKETGADRRERQRLQELSELARIEYTKKVEEARVAEEERLARLEEARVAEEERLARLEEQRLARLEEERLARLEEERITRLEEYNELKQDAMIKSIINLLKKQLYMTPLATVKANRENYIKLWHYMNQFGDSYDPLFPDGKPIDASINYRRIDYKKQQDRRAFNRIKKYEDAAAESMSDEYSKNRFLGSKILISYNSDSINKNIVKETGSFLTSPNSIVIHCTTLKRDENDLHGSVFSKGPPSNFFGHVTVNIVRNLSSDQIDAINNLTRVTGGVKRNATNFEKEDYELEIGGNIYHYGIMNPTDTAVRSWETVYNRAGGTSAQKIKNFTLTDTVKFFPDHNNVETLMKEYYLKCILTCPPNIVFDGSKLSYRDLTDWGPPQILWEEGRGSSLA
jgi:hypothetical protein